MQYGLVVNRVEGKQKKKKNEERGRIDPNVHVHEWEGSKEISYVCDKVQNIRDCTMPALHCSLGCL